jgi:hypothetical protein
LRFFEHFFGFRKFPEKREDVCKKLAASTFV